MTGKKGCVLVVDDDAGVREALVDALTYEGFETAPAGDGEAALDYLRSHPAPSVVLLDWNMAPMNGPELMIELAKDPALATIPVVLLTADAKAPEMVKAHPFVGCLMKPPSLDALLEIVGRYCV
jgi:CheY-like chemotaxis protein